MTELLYNQSAYISEFEAVVLSCEAQDDFYLVTLDRTAFFPEQGGQYADSGTIAGRPVLDVQIKNGIVYHTMEIPMTPGETVCGKIDWKLRFDRMQNHTGEHIVSGYFHRMFGYENVGFHLNDTFLTLDTNGPLTKEQLTAAETYANEIVSANLPVEVTYPKEEALKTLDYRSKLELTENVRIVTIPGVDVCACCAPHVARTGEIGMIKIISAIHYKGGMRLTIKCGMRALQDYRVKDAVLSDIAVRLSLKPEEVGGGVEHLLAQILDLKNELTASRQSLTAYKIAELKVTDGNLCLFEAHADHDILRAIVNAGMEKCGGICAAFTPDQAGGYLFVIGAKDIPLRARAKEITTALHGRGGGNDRMISGTAKAEESEIRAYIEAFH